MKFPVLLFFTFCFFPEFAGYLTPRDAAKAVITPKVEIAEGWVNWTDGLVLEDGGITSVGFIYRENQFYLCLARFSAEGQLDTTFHDQGITSFSIPVGDGYYAQMNRRKTGELLVLFSSPKDNHTLYLAQFYPNGELDRSFGKDGMASIEMDLFWINFHYLALQEDGEILILGGDFNTITLVQLTENGALNPSFGQNGKVDISEPYTNLFGGVVVPLENGKILVGTSKMGMLVLYRLKANGFTDYTFGIDGLAEPSINFKPYEVLTTSEGSFIFLGQGKEENTMGKPVAVKCRPDGSLDTAYGFGGHISSRALLEKAISGAILPDGSLITIGSLINEEEESISIRAFTPEGAPLTSFGRYGFVNPNIPEGNGNFIKYTPNGDLLAGGGTGEDAFLLRLGRNGSRQPFFGKEGKVITSFSRSSLQ